MEICGCKLLNEKDTMGSTLCGEAPQAINFDERTALIKRNRATSKKVKVLQGIPEMNNLLSQAIRKIE